MPVPSVIITRWSQPRPAPPCHSPSTAARASFSNNNGRPSDSRAQPARSSPGASANLPKVRTTERPPGAITHGSAHTSASTGSPPAAAIPAQHSRSTGSIRSSDPCPGVSNTRTSRATPAATTPALLRVPPKSTAITLIRGPSGSSGRR